MKDVSITYIDNVRNGKLGAVDGGAISCFANRPQCRVTENDLSGGLCYFQHSLHFLNYTDHKSILFAKYLHHLYIIY